MQITEALHTNENKLKRDFHAEGINIKWCTDIIQFKENTLKKVV